MQGLAMLGDDECFGFPLSQELARHWIGICVRYCHSYGLNNQLFQLVTSTFVVCTYHWKNDRTHLTPAFSPFVNAAPPYPFTNFLHSRPSSSASRDDTSCCTALCHIPQINSLCHVHRFWHYISPSFRRQVFCSNKIRKLVV